MSTFHSHLIAILALGALALPATEALAKTVRVHPALAATAEVPNIDPNTFIVGHPASPRNKVVHANGEHPGVLAHRAFERRGIDPNTFIVQPPASVTWTMGPASR